MNKSFLFAINALLFFTSVNSQPLHWAGNHPCNDVSNGHSIAVESNGKYMYLAGYTDEDIDVDFGPGVQNLVLKGSPEGYICKYDSLGNHIWSFSLKSSWSSVISDVEVDDEGGVYIVGFMIDTVDLDPGTGTAQYITNADGSMFVAKYDSSGAYQWSFQLSGTEDYYIHAIEYDFNGKIFVAGRFDNTVDFNPGAPVFSLTSANSQPDGFIAVYDTSGSFINAFRIGGLDYDEIEDIVVYDDGTLYVAGHFELTVDFDPGAGITNLTSNGNSDGFVARYANNCALMWAGKLGGTSYDYTRGLDVDNHGNVVTTGLFQGTADMDPGPGIYNITQQGYGDYFVAKLDSSGNFLWCHGAGGAADTESGYDVTVDNVNSVYATGYIQSTTDFNPGAGVFNLTPLCTYRDNFIVKYSSGGNFLWAFQIGSSTGVTSTGEDLAFDQFNNMYATGYASGVIDFDPGPGTYNLSSPTTTANTFLARYRYLDNTSSVNDEQSSLLQLSAAPNPFDEYTVIRLANSLANNVYNMKYILSDISGKTVNCSFSLEGEYLIIRRGNLLPGCYFLLVENQNKQQQVIKLVLR